MWSYRASGGSAPTRTCANWPATPRRDPNAPRSAQRTIRRRGTRIEIVFAVDVARPQSTNQVADPASVVGVDVGVRRLATVADADGNILARHSNPRALDCVLDEMRVADQPCRSRCVEGSRRYRERSRELGALHARARNIRSNCLHHITTDLAKSHGTTVAEGAVWSGLAQQKHLLGARTRRRQLHDAAPGEIRRQLGYKTRWYGSQLIIADKFYPSSKTCPLMWACPKHRMGRQMDLRPVRDGPRPRRQRRGQPRCIPAARQRCTL